MSVHAGSARPQRMSVGAALLRVLVTLALFFVVFLPFLLAPLLALGVGFLIYVVLRSRGTRSRPGPTGSPAPAASGFGAGTS